MTGLFGLFGSFLEARALGKIAGEVGDYVDAWLRLVASLFSSCFVTFFGTWGVAGGAALLAKANCWAALVGGFLAGLAAMAFVYYKLWKDGKYWDAKKKQWVRLTAGMSIVVTSEIAELAEETNTSMTSMK